jgi:FtsH-binding integral membrane protein
MHGRTIALAVAACGWLVASLIAFVLVASFGFFAIGLIGLLLWFICVRIDLEKDAAVGSGWTPHLIGSQHEARERLSPEQRAAWREEQSVAMQSTRFFKHLGIGLTAIGAAGFGWFQL